MSEKELNLTPSPEDIEIARALVNRVFLDLCAAYFCDSEKQVSQPEKGDKT